MGLPVERKVQASTAAAAFSGLLLWAAGRYIFKGSVPDVVASWVYVIVPSVITFMAGYAAKHTPRTPALAVRPDDGYRPPHTRRPPRADVSSLPDPPMQDLPGPTIPAEKTLIPPQEGQP